MRLEEDVQGCGIKVHTAFAKLNTEPAIDALPSPVVVFVFFTEPPPSFTDEDLELFVASSKLSCLVAIFIFVILIGIYSQLVEKHDYILFKLNELIYIEVISP